MTRLVLPVALLLALPACAGVQADLDRAEAHFGDARYEHALVWLEEIEFEAHDLGPDDTARYYFLRGMVHYRLGARDDALHYFALAKATLEEEGVDLPPEHRRELEARLEELTPTVIGYHAREAVVERHGGEGAEPPPADGSDNESAF